MWGEGENLVMWFWIPALPPQQGPGRGGCKFVFHEWTKVGDRVARRTTSLLPAAYVSKQNFFAYRVFHHVTDKSFRNMNEIELLVV